VSLLRESLFTMRSAVVEGTWVISLTRNSFYTPALFVCCTSERRSRSFAQFDPELNRTAPSLRVHSWERLRSS